MSTTPYIPSITVDSVIESLGTFLQPFVGTVSIIRAQVNRAAMPSGPFVELTEMGSSDIEYPRQWYDTTNLVRDIIGPKKIMVQADFYGPLSGDWCNAVKTVWRTPWAVSQFPSGIAPLYCDDGREIPLITGEDQYERRWCLTCTMQYNPIVIVPQQSANTLSMNVVQDVDA